MSNDPHTVGGSFHDCWFLTGPTAVGKTAIALEIAERTGAEIVALDSMTVYRGMEIGAAKPTAADRARVPHHLLDLLDPTEPCNLDWFLRQAESACAGIRQRGRQPLFVGGTPLYLKAALRGIFAGPPADLKLRAELEAEARLIGVPALHQRLAAVDPPAAERILVNDLRRIVRALEVYQHTGRPISFWQRQFATPADPCPKAACLLRPRVTLVARIHDRIDTMLGAGWIDEVRALEACQLVASTGVAQMVGYREIAQFLAGQISWDDMRTAIQTRTRQFAKRQLTWFRHLEELTIFDLTDENDETNKEKSDDILGRLIAFFTS